MDDAPSIHGIKHLGPILAGLNAVSALLAERDLTFFLAALALSVPCAIGGELAYRRSLLLREGPDRRTRRPLS